MLNLLILPLGMFLLVCDMAIAGFLVIVAIYLFIIEFRNSLKKGGEQE